MKTALYKCRAYEGVSLEILAGECHSTRSTLHRLESGGTINPAGKVCFNLLKRYERYGLTLEHLIYPERFPDFIVKDNSQQV